MEYGAIDLHLRRSQFRIVREDGPVVQEGKFDTTRADLTRVFGGRPPLRLYRVAAQGQHRRRGPAAPGRARTTGDESARRSDALSSPGVRARPAGHVVAGAGVDSARSSATS
jgi:hypothetical protein